LESLVEILAEGWISGQEAKVEAATLSAVWVKVSHNALEELEVKSGE